MITRSHALRLATSAAVAAALPRTALAQEGSPAVAPVRVGIIKSVSDAPILIADKNGYFKEEGLTVAYVAFGSAAQMVVPLGAGQLDVGAGGTSAGLFNAIGRGLDMRIVADKATDPPGYGFAPLLVRTELIKSGRYKTLKDLKGMTIAISAPGSSSWPELAAVLDKARLKWDDVKRVALDYADHIVGLRNGSVDASITIEPAATAALATGSATRIMGSDEYYPNQEVAVLIYSGAFMKSRANAVKFMRAYLKGTRFFNDALKDGKLAGRTSPEVIAILAEGTVLKDPELLKKITPNGVDPNGKVNVASMRRDIALYRQLGTIESPVTAEQTWDPSFAADAVKSLGLYKPNR
jgi:NitT/TauT family transport system substrate-binding protein